MPHYDIIGDIHGQADLLVQLLEALGYSQIDGVFQSDPEARNYSKAVFVGDFIDRNPDNRRVIEIVRPMVESGHALAVMGNHEFNAICYHTRHPDTGQPLRAHSEKNRSQHQSFLDEYPLGDKDTRDVINWFKTLPLFLELETNAGLRVFEVDGEEDEPQRLQFSNRIRIVHACWDRGLIDYLSDRLGQPARIDEAFLIESSQEGTPAFTAVETVLKGPEVPLPDGMSFLDKDGHERDSIRLKWWAAGQTYRDLALVPRDQMMKIPDLPVPPHYREARYAPEDPPVFFGHYWMSGDPKGQRHNVACLDYSAGKGGPLAAYIWINWRSRLGGGVLRGDQFTSTDELQNEPPEDYTYPEEQRRAAWQISMDQKHLRTSEICGCFYCLSLFEPIELDPEDEWPDCPRCGVDYLIGSASGLPITRRFLAEAKQFWLEPPFPDVTD